MFLQYLTGVNRLHKYQSYKTSDRFFGLRGSVFPYIVHNVGIQGETVGDHAPVGEFEQLVLLAVLQIGDSAYGVPIRNEIEHRTGRTVSRGAVYTTLDRLEAKGLLGSQLGDPTPERSGKAKRYYRVESSGIEALKESQKALRSMWTGLEAVLGEL